MKKMHEAEAIVEKLEVTNISLKRKLVKAS
jgi:hypothetical protein